MPIMNKLIVDQELARTQCITCSKCGTKQSYIISRRRTWRSVLRIPIVPVSTVYCYYCPHCGNSHPLVKQQARDMAKRARASAQL